MPIRIVLADDHLVVRQGLKVLLEKEGFIVAGEALNGREAVQQIERLHPDVAIFDLSMPILNGMDAAREAAKIAPATRTILLTMYPEEQYVLEALRAGVKGYVLKTKAAGDLVRAIREVHRGETYLSPGISTIVIDAFLRKADLPPDPLTARERQVLQLIAEGNTTKEIAVQLEISVKTAESHRTAIMTKLDIHDIAGLVRHAMHIGLISC